MAREEETVLLFVRNTGCKVKLEIFVSMGK
jgi:hypothetical protein